MRIRLRSCKGETMLKSKKVYEYSGPVIVDGQRATWKWTARTWAVSPQKAQSNLIHRYREQNNLGRSNRVELDGNVKVSMSSIIVDEAKPYIEQLVLDI